MEDLGLEVMTPKQEKRRERMLKQLDTMEPDHRLINPWSPSYECDLEEDVKEKILQEQLYSPKHGHSQATLSLMNTQ